jgi:hypothetical protein
MALRAGSKELQQQNFATRADELKLVRHSASASPIAVPSAECDLAAVFRLR